MSYELKTGVGDICACEMTVKQQRAVMKSAADRAQKAADTGEFDAYAEQLFEDITLYEIEAMSTATMDELEELRESELRKIADACITANEHFFRMRAKDRKRTQLLMDQNPDLLNTLVKQKLKGAEKPLLS